MRQRFRGGPAIAAQTNQGWKLNWMPHNFANQAADFHASHIIDHRIKKYWHISIRRIRNNPNGHGTDLVFMSHGKYCKAFHVNSIAKRRKICFFLCASNNGVAC